MSNTKKKAHELTHQEKMSIYNEYQSGNFYLKELVERHNVSIYTIKVVNQEIHDLIRYKLYGEPPKEPKVCNICGGKVKFNKCDIRKSKSGFVYYCVNCHAWVGTHPNAPKVALGELGDKDIRKKRKELHQWFDKLWRNHEEREIYYNRLSKELGKERCHFSQMSMSELERSLEIVKKWWIQKYDI